VSPATLEGLAILASVALAFVSLLALVFGSLRRERARVRRAMVLLVVVCAAIAPGCWLIASALHARERRQPYTERQRRLLVDHGIDLGLDDRFDREYLVGGAPYAWFPAVAAALLAVRIRFLPSPSKTE
jgi:hypothetical protein